MSVTREVSQLEMSALKFRMLEKSRYMSVTAETSQSAMGPYVAVAAVGSSLYSWTAVFRAASVEKKLETPLAVMRTRLPSNLERRNELCSAWSATVFKFSCRYVSANASPRRTPSAAG